MFLKNSDIISYVPEEDTWLFFPSLLVGEEVTHWFSRQPSETSLGCTGEKTGLW